MSIDNILCYSENKTPEITFENKTLLVGEFDSDPAGFTFNSSGYKLFLLGKQTAKIYQFSLSVQYDVSSCTFDDKVYDISSVTVSPIGIILKDDNETLYIVGADTKKVHEFSITNVNDISSSIYINDLSNIDLDDNAESIYFDYDTTQLIVLYRPSSTTTKMDSYFIETDWKIPTLSTTHSTQFDHFTQVYATHFRDDGAKFYLLHRNSSVEANIREYDLSTPWDLSTASLVRGKIHRLNGFTDFFVNGKVDIFLSANGLKCYIVWGNAIYQYNLSTAWSIDTISNSFSARMRILDDFGVTIGIAKMYVDPTGSYVFCGDDDGRLFRTGSINNFELTDGNVSSIQIDIAVDFIRGIFLKPDGTKIYYADTTNVYEIELPTPWDILNPGAQTILPNKTSAFNSFINTLEGMYIRPDGSSMLLTNGGSPSGGIRDYEFDAISSTIQNTTSTVVTSIGFNPDYTEAYTYNATTDKFETHIFEDRSLYVFSKSQNFFTGYKDSAIDVSDKFTYFQISTDGETLYTIVDSLKIQEYSITPIFANLELGSSIESESEVIVGLAEYNFDSFWIGNSGNNLYASSGSYIYQFELAVPYDLSSIQKNPIRESIVSDNGTDIFFSPSGDYLITLVNGGTALTTASRYPLNTPWDISTRNPRQYTFFPQSDPAVTAISFNDTGSKMFIASVDNTITAYSVNDFLPDDTSWLYSVKFKNTPKSFVFNSDGSELYITVQDAVEKYELSSNYDLRTKKFAGAFFTEHNQNVRISPDDSKIYTANNHSTIFSYDILATNSSQNFYGRQGALKLLQGEVYDPHSLAFNSTGTKLYVTGGVNVNNDYANEIRGYGVFEYDLSVAYDTSTAVYNSNFYEIPFGIDPFPITAMFFKPDGTKLYTAAKYDPSNIESHPSTVYIQSHTLSIPFDLTSITRDYIYFDTNVDTAVNSIYINNAGNYLFWVSGTKVYRTELNSPWSIASSVATTSRQLQGILTWHDPDDLPGGAVIDTKLKSSEWNEIAGIYFKPDGTKMYLSPKAGVNTAKGEVFEIDIDPGWILRQQIEPNYFHTISGNEAFGRAVAISGDTVIVGNYLDDEEGSSAGAAFIFDQTAGTWFEDEKLLADDAQANDRFGFAVDIAGDFAIVGAYQEDSNGPLSGAAYIYTNQAGGSWHSHYEQKIDPTDADGGDQFGRAVAIDGTTAAVGAPGRDQGGLESVGAVYIYNLDDSNSPPNPPNQFQQLTVSGLNGAALFGHSVAISGDTIIVGCPGYASDSVTKPGAAFIYTRSGTNSWSLQQTILASDGDNGDDFGYSVAIDGDTAIVGAPEKDETGFSNVGASYIFTRSGSTWTEQQKLSPSVSEDFIQFGYSVAISGDTAIVGAPFEDVRGDGKRGTAYIFYRLGSTWTQQIKLFPNTTGSNEKVGSSVAIDGDTAIIGADFGNRAYMFTDEDEWSLVSAKYSRKSFIYNHPFSITASLPHRDIVFDSVGSKFYAITDVYTTNLIQNTNNTGYKPLKAIHQFSLDTNWDLEPKKYILPDLLDDSDNDLLFDYPSLQKDMQFNSTGTKLYVLHKTALYVYNLNTAYDLNSASLENIVTRNAQFTDRERFYITADESKLYLMYGTSGLRSVTFDTPGVIESIDNFDNIDRVSVGSGGPAVYNHTQGDFTFVRIIFNNSGDRIFGIAHTYDRIYSKTVSSYNWDGRIRAADPGFLNRSFSPGIHNFEFSSDGLKFIYTTNAAGTEWVVEELAAPYDIQNVNTTVAYSGITNPTTGTGSTETSGDFRFDPTGTILVKLTGFNTLETYNLATAYDLNTALLTNIADNSKIAVEYRNTTVWPFTELLTTFDFNDDGTILFTGWRDRNTDKIAIGVCHLEVPYQPNGETFWLYSVFELNLDPNAYPGMWPGSLRMHSTGGWYFGFTSWSKVVLSQETAKLVTTAEFIVKDDGTTMLAVESGSQVVARQYRFRIPGDLSTIYLKREDDIDLGFDVSTSGMAVSFKPDGSKIYFFDLTNVYEYTLATPWEISTIGSPVVSLHPLENVLATTGPTFMPSEFSSDGTKLFIFTGTGLSTGLPEINDEFPDGGIYEYTLETPWDASTLTYDQAEYDSSYEVGFGEDVNVVGLSFSNDGNKFYTVSNADDTYGDTPSSILREYFFPDDSTIEPYDITNLSRENKHVVLASIVASSIGGLRISVDGTKLFALQETDTNTRIDEYFMSTPYDISSINPSAVNSFNLNYTTPSFNFNNNGTKMFAKRNFSSTVIGIESYTIGSAYSLGTAVFDNQFVDLVDKLTQLGLDSESARIQIARTRDFAFNNNGTILYCAKDYNILVLFLSASYDLSTITNYVIQNISTVDDHPGGIQTISYVSNDTLLIGNYKSAQILKLPDWNFNLLEDLRVFSVGDWSQYTSTSFGFGANGSKMYTMDPNTKTIFQFGLSTPWLPSTHTFDHKVLTVDPVFDPDELLTDFTFKPDGTLLFISTMTPPDYYGLIYQFELSIPWDISTASFLYTTSSNDPFSRPDGLNFKPDGTKLIQKETNVIVEYNLSVPWDIRTMTQGNTTTVTLGKIRFNQNGTRFYYGSGQEIYGYNLLEPWNISSGNIINLSSPEEYTPNELVYHDIYSIALGDDDSFLFGLYVINKNLAASKNKIELFTWPTTRSGSMISNINNSFNLFNTLSSIKGYKISYNGKTLFVYGTDKIIYQFTLGTAFDISSAFVTKSFDISDYVTTDQYYIYFNNAGTQFFVLETDSSEIYYYKMYSSNNIESSEYVTSLTIPAETETDPVGIQFSPSGKKLYFAGKDSKLIYQYDLSTGFDLLTAVFNNKSIDIQAYVPAISNLIWNSSGTLLTVIATNYRAYQFETSIPYEILTADFKSSFVYENLQNNDLFELGDNSNKLYTYSGYSLKQNTISNSEYDIRPLRTEEINSLGLYLLEKMAEQKYHTGSIIAEPFIPDLINNVLFSRSLSGIKFNSDGSKCFILTDYTRIEEYNLNLNYDISYRTLENVLYLTSPVFGTDFDLSATGDKLFVLTENAFQIYSLTDAFNLSTAAYDFDINLDSISSDIENFSIASNGLKIYLSSPTLSRITEASLSSAYNMSTISKVNSITLDTIPDKIYSKNDGTKLFILSRYTTEEYAFNTNYDITSLTLTSSTDALTPLVDKNKLYNTAMLDASSEDSLAEAIWFSPDGLIMFLLGDTNKKIYRYDLGTAFDINTATLSNQTISFSDYDDSANESGFTGLYFKDDGSLLYVLSRTSMRIHQFSLPTPWDLSSAQYLLYYDIEFFAFKTLTVDDLFISPQGTELFIYADDRDRDTQLHQFNLAEPWIINSASLNTDVNTNIGPIDTHWLDNSIMVGPAGNTIYKNMDSDIKVYQLDNPYAINGLFIDTGATIEIDPDDSQHLFWTNSKSTITKSFYIDFDSNKFFLLNDNKIYEFQYVKNTPTGVTFNNQGNLITVLNDKQAYQYSLATSFDLDISATPDNATKIGTFVDNYYIENINSEPTLPVQQKILGSNLSQDYRFGGAVDISGNSAIVGATIFGSASGNAYIYTTSDGGNTWTEQQILGPQNGDFGNDVAISGDIAIVGAPLDDPGGLTNAGAAYIYTRSGSTWTLQETLTGSSSDERFGYAVDLDGDTAIVGAYLNDTGSTNAGAAFVYTTSDNGTTWTFQDQLVANDAVVSDFAATGVAISGNTAVINNYRDTAAGSNSGAVYVFTRSGSTWTQQQKLVADDASAGDYFGWSVDINGETIIVGAPEEEQNGDRSGAAYVFTRSINTWTQQQKLDPSDSGLYHEFGLSVSISGSSDIVIVGAHHNDTLAYRAGAAYIFTRSGSTWTEQVVLTASDASASDKFGCAVALDDGNFAIVGAFLDDESGTDAGAAYIFQPEESNWNSFNTLPGEPTFVSEDKDIYYVSSQEFSVFPDIPPLSCGLDSSDPNTTVIQEGLNDKSIYNDIADNVIEQMLADGPNTYRIGRTPPNDGGIWAVEQELFDKINSDITVKNYLYKKIGSNGSVSFPPLLKLENGQLTTFSEEDILSLIRYIKQRIHSTGLGTYEITTDGNPPDSVNLWQNMGQLEDFEANQAIESFLGYSRTVIEDVPTYTATYVSQYVGDSPAYGSAYLGTEPVTYNKTLTYSGGGFTRESTFFRFQYYTANVSFFNSSNGQFYTSTQQFVGNIPQSYTGGATYFRTRQVFLDYTGSLDTETYLDSYTGEKSYLTTTNNDYIDANLTSTQTLTLWRRIG